MKKIVLLAFVLTLLSTAVIVGFVSPVVSYSAETELLMEVDLPVHNLDSGKNFSTIQGAITDNETLDGNTILVDAGTYYEHVVVNKSVSLIGEDKETTIIDGNMWGTVVVVTASGVLISNFTIRNSMDTASYSGVKVEMDNCNITNNIITNNWFGVYLGYYPGQYPRPSSNNIISGNNIKNNRVGVYLSGCANSTIAGNNITNSYCGVDIRSGSDNRIYHNNFIENFMQVGLPEVMSIQTFSILPSVWKICGDLCCVSYPSGGNYWSDYNGTDLLSGSYQNETGSDGIGDTAYTNYYSLPDNYPYPTLVTIDSYPLMGPISFFNAGTWNKTTYYVHTVSNSTISDFYFNKYDKLVSFNVNGTDGTVGFCRIAIPKTLMCCNASEDWNVTVDYNPPIHLKVTEDANCTYLYFTYSHTIHNVKITITYVIEEIPEEVPPPVEEEVPFWTQWWFWTIVSVGIVALSGAIYFLTKRKPPTPTVPPLPPEGTP